MTQGNEAKLILLFTLPVMAGNFLQQLYNTMDSIIVGQYLGEASLSAVGTCASLTMLFIALSTGLSSGGGVMIAQYYGAKRMDDLRRSVSTILIMLVVIGLALSAFGSIFARALLDHVLSVPAELLDEATVYLSIYCLGLVFQCTYNSISYILRSIGDSRATLIFLLISSVVNIMLDLLFVLYFNWGVGGAAAATVIAQAVSAVCSVIYMWRKYEFMRFSRKDFVYDPEKGRMALRLGIPTTIQQCIVSFGNILIQRIVNYCGTAAMAAFVASARIENYIFVPIMGFNIGMSTFTGQNVGAGKLDRVRSGLKKTMLMSAVCCLLMSSLAMLFASPLVSLFGVEGEALQLGIDHVRFVSPFYIIFAMYFCFGGVLNGSGDVRVSAMVTTSTLFVRIISSYILSYGLGLGFVGVYVAVPIGWAAALLIGGLRYRSGKWKTKAIVKN